LDADVKAEVERISSGKKMEISLAVFFMASMQQEYICTPCRHVLCVRASILGTTDPVAVAREDILVTQNLHKVYTTGGKRKGKKTNHAVRGYVGAGY
jgi:hypothetical protein